tara:strand:+ start:400 stop:876 length:477 start_codon:yes stop_codon:yes gene_type:complete
VAVFEVGDTVRNVAADVVGVVVEIDGETVYLEQANGAEVDFKASSLVLEEDFQAKHGTVVRDDEASHANDPVYDEVIRNLYPAILELGEAVHASVKSVPGVTPRNWGALTSLQKLNAVSIATDVPVQDWVDASKPGAKKALGPLQLSILANRSGKPGR